jgi:hypothetical protein
MDEKIIAALEKVAGRALTEVEKVDLDPFVLARNDVEIARQLSAGRTKYAPTTIGIGTVVAVIGAQGGNFLDAVNNLGANDRQVHWGFDPVRRGVLDLSVPAARAMLADLKTKIPDYAADIDKLLGLGLVPDPIDYNAVSDALNAVGGV